MWELYEKMLDFLWEPCYCITVREENKAEFHSHLSAFRKRLGFILHECTAEILCGSGYKEVWILSMLFL